MINPFLKATFAFILLGLSFQSISQVRKFNFERKQIIDPSKIDIVRDQYGVPHIFAETDAEVAYGLHYATAEDDINTMQYMLMASKCHLGLRDGPEGAKIDYAVQLMDLHETVAQNYEREISDEFKLVLEGACQGANAYAKDHPEEVWLKNAFPVTPQEVVIGYMLAQSLMAGVDGAIKNILNGKVLNQIPKEINDDGIGSNAYAFNSEMTDHGNTYQIINAHQPIDGLLSWYEAHLPQRTRVEHYRWPVSWRCFHFFGNEREHQLGTHNRRS